MPTDKQKKKKDPLSTLTVASHKKVSPLRQEEKGRHREKPWLDKANCSGEMGELREGWGRKCERNFGPGLGAREKA